MAETSQTDSYLKQFEPDVFWQKHRRQIVWGLVAVLTVGVLAYLWQWKQTQQAEAAAAKLADARDIPALTQVIKDYPGQEMAAQALLRVADMQYSAGRYADAASSYQQFLKDFSNHALRDSAQFGLAAIAEAQGEYEQARSQYNTMAGGRSYVSVGARLGVARCTELLGQVREARQLYEELMASVQGTPWQAEAYMRYTVLGRDVPKQAAPSFPPAPAQTAPLTLLPGAPAPK